MNKRVENVGAIIESLNESTNINEDRSSYTDKDGGTYQAISKEIRLPQIFNAVFVKDTNYGIYGVLLYEGNPNKGIFIPERDLTTLIQKLDSGKYFKK